MRMPHAQEPKKTVRSPVGSFLLFYGERRRKITLPADRKQRVETSDYEYQPGFYGCFLDFSLIYILSITLSVWYTISEYYFTEVKSLDSFKKCETNRF